jgi:hypothetical protein
MLEHVRLASVTQTEEHSEEPIQYEGRNGRYLSQHGRDSSVIDRSHGTRGNRTACFIEDPYP